MIGPRMATMLAFLLTDARVAAADLQAILSRGGRGVVQLHLGRGAHQHQRHRAAAGRRQRPRRACSGARTSPRSPRWSASACMELARMIPDDGEGATHLITIDVEGCRDREQARVHRPGRRRQPARQDRHPRRRPELGPDRLGRRLRRASPSRSATCRSGSTASPLYRDGVPAALRRRRRLGAAPRRTRDAHPPGPPAHGDAACRFWTCDLTAEYIRLNADYTT